MTVENHGLLYDYKIYIEYLNLYCSMLSSMNIEYKHNIRVAIVVFLTLTVGINLSNYVKMYLGRSKVNYD